MPSLNQVADFTASRLNRPFDDMLKAEIKFAFINELSLLMRRTIDANGVDKTYLASFIVELQKVDNLDTLGYTGEYEILRSVNRIPMPIRYKTPVPFIFVGTHDNKISFGYANGYETDLLKELPNIGNSVVYDFINQYLYIHNNTKLDRVKLISPYANFNLITDSSTTGNGIPYQDDMELPYPEDLINSVILTLLQGLFGNLDSKDKVVATHLDNQ